MARRVAPACRVAAAKAGSPATPMASVWGAAAAVRAGAVAPVVPVVRVVAQVVVQAVVQAVAPVVAPNHIG